MIISKLVLKNWRNFRSVDIRLRERIYIIGPNASGKSNLLDVFRFIRDVASQNGGGLQKAVRDRGLMKKLRSLHARKDPEIVIQVELSANADSPPKWRYTLALRSEGKGLQRPIISREKVVDLTTNATVCNRPDADDDLPPELAPAIQ